MCPTIRRSRNTGNIPANKTKNKNLWYTIHMDFKDKTVLITGGSSGIGKTTALLFAQNGADVVITFKKNEAGAKETTNEMEKLGVKTLAIQADLVFDDQAKDMVEKTVGKFGKLDIVVNNAGGYIEGDEWNGNVDIWTESIKQNLVSVMSVSKYAAEIFLKQKSGVFINIASRHGVDGQYDSISYAASKSGVINVTQAYAKLLIPFGRANVISPSTVWAGYWLTAPKEEIDEKLAQKKNHQFIKSETIAQKVLFLASDEAKDINGENFVILE